MNYETNRLQTFRDWPTNAAVCSERIAKAGFYYTGQALVVQCFLCGSTVSEWNYGDQAMTLHRLANPECPFVLDPVATCNVPLIAANNDSVSSNTRENHNPINSSNPSQNIPWNSNLPQGDLKRYSNRLNTFANWPISTTISPERLARSGFYYLQEAEMVKCAYCQGLIYEWEPGDDPDRKHRIHFPNCDFYLRDERGEVATCNVSLIAANNDSSSNTRENHNPINSSNPSQNIPWNSNLLQGDLTRYSNRLNTYENWPISTTISPERLARSGFYYLQEADMVKCAYCQGLILEWEPGDDPDREHRIHFPNCDFYLRDERGEDLSSGKAELGNVKLLPGATSNFSELGIQHHSAPRQPKHATYEGRLRTFQGWPSNLKQTPEMLAGAGFYYVGSQDQVRCFHCDGGLTNWEETDDAWIEHAKWFPKCGFIALVRGKEFIKQCVENRPPLDPSILAFSRDDNSITPAVSPEVRPPLQPPQQPRQVTDADLERLLDTPVAAVALSIGLHVGRVKMALKRRMERVGIPYQNSDQLIEDVTQIQLGEEDITSRRTPDSPSAELTHLLNQIMTTAEAASCSNAQTDSMLSNVQNQSNVPRRRRSQQTGEVEADDKTQTEEKSSKNDKTVSLLEENRRLKEARLCKICMDREVAVVFLPCGHLATCVFCAPSLSHCPMCRQEISATVRTFLA